MENGKLEITVGFVASAFLEEEEEEEEEIQKARIVNEDRYLSRYFPFNRL